MSVKGNLGMIQKRDIKPRTTKSIQARPGLSIWRLLLTIWVHTVRFYVTIHIEIRLIVSCEIIKKR